MKIIFFGTPLFAEKIFRDLFENKVSILAVVTQPDRPQGRSLQKAFSPVKEACLELLPDVPILQPEKASQETFLETLSAFHADLFVVVAFGQILSQKILDTPLLGCINIHASLLPKYRGAAPIQRAIMAGEKETGVAIQKMVRKMDAGDVIALSKIEIDEEMTGGKLQEKLCDLAKPLLLSVLKEYEKGVPKGIPQNEEEVTFAPKISTEEGEIDFKLSAREIHNKIRAFSPRPGAWCQVFLGNERKRLKILRSKIHEKQGEVGKIFLPDPIIACQNKSIELLEVQLEGKRVMSGKDWLLGLQKPPSFV